MCGIVGYIGDKNAAHVLVQGLKRLEYRGYDSAGIAVLDGGLKVKKSKGKIAELEKIVDYEKLADCHIGIGHTRWATHGEPSDVNSHPHTNCSGDVAVVHNGIIENYAVLKKKLIEKGHIFKSQTDSEVVAHLISHYYKGETTLFDAVQIALSKLEGAYGLAIVSNREPGKLIAAKKGSPLVIGLGDNEMLIASDICAIVEHTRQVFYVEDDEVVVLTQNSFDTYDLNSNKISKEIKNIDWDIEGIEKQGYDHFMLKEIYEQVETIKNAYRGRLLHESGNVRLDGLNLSVKDASEIKKIIFLACGTSWHAGMIGEYLIEEYARIPVEVEYASEFRYRRPVLSKGDVVIVISQSGETADTLAAMREAKAKGIPVYALTNVVGSTIARESDGGVYLHAGPEVGVASTKAFTSQVTVIILLTVLLARKGCMTLEEGQKILSELESVSDMVKTILDKNEEIKSLAEIYKSSHNCLYLGRGPQFPVALEGALKLKEISYIHAEGYPAAEMKHGPIALIDKNMPVVFVAPEDDIYSKILSNMQEVRARGGRILAVATEGDQTIDQYADHVIYVPKASKMILPLLTVIPLQLLSYHIAVLRGCNVDQPRNLAKSVTVE